METPRSLIARGGEETPAPATQPSSSLDISAEVEGLPDGRLLSNQSYNSIVSSGNSRLHAGNVYNNHYHIASLTTHVQEPSDEQKSLLRTFLRCLNFKEASSRHAGIATAHPDTCRWVVDCPQYRRWRNPDAMTEHHGCLWIKGKPGAGKSTIMKGLLRHAKEVYSNDKIVFFFFNARGTALERSTEGLYRSILHQTASNVSSLLVDLDAETMEVYAKEGWPLELLKDLCRAAVRNLTSEIGITVFIDALDEGGVEDDVRDMVTFIEELAAGNSSSNRSLHVCLASRHYPTISMQNVERLSLETFQDHDEDVAKYVRAQIRIGNAAMRTELVSSICARASGVFLWVVMVVKILNKEADRGNQHKITAKLREIPGGLHDLFERVIERDDENDPCLLPALIWVLFSRAPLKSTELYYAIMISTGQLCSENVAWNPFLVTSTVAENFLVSTSKGLAECAQGVSVTVLQRRPTHVQIIHESVREYLFATGLRKLDENLKVNFEAKCHWRLAKWCLTYMQLVADNGLFEETEQARSYRQCPLLEYATEYALAHAETAARLGYRHIVHNTAPIETWRRLDQPYSHLTMLHLLVQRNLHHLVKIELKQNSKRAAKERQMYLDGQSLWVVACQHGGFDVLEVLLENGINPEDENPDCVSKLLRAVRDRNWRTIQSWARRQRAMAKDVVFNADS